MKAARKPNQRSLRQVFATPLLLALISIVGLVAALTGDGFRDALSWVALGVPVLVAIWAWRRRA